MGQIEYSVGTSKLKVAGLNTADPQDDKWLYHVQIKDRILLDHIKDRINSSSP